MEFGHFYQGPPKVANINLDNRLGVRIQHLRRSDGFSTYRVKQIIFIGPRNDITPQECISKFLVLKHRALSLPLCR